MSLCPCTVGVGLYLSQLSTLLCHTRRESLKLTAIATLQSGDKCHASLSPPTEVAVDHVSPRHQQHRHKHIVLCGITVHGSTFTYSANRCRHQLKTSIQVLLHAVTL